jgi:hypothetical protein
MDEVEVLVWAAGGPAPTAADIDEDLLLASVRAHHLGVRLHSLLQNTTPVWASASLRCGVADLAAEAWNRSRQLRRAYREVLDAVTGPTRPVLAKGIAYPLLLNSGQAATWSADLDLFAADPAALRDALTGLGYQVDTKSPPEPYGRRVRHEFAKLDRNSVQIDLHSRFPAWRYPVEAADPRRLSPPEGTVGWPCVSSLDPGEITTAALLNERTTRPDLGTPLDITSPEMTALVSSCHLFASYLTEFPARYATIRLGELANLVALTSWPRFDWTRFYRLVAASAADDAVAYAFALAAVIVGRRFNPPPAALFPSDPLPPRALWFARGDGSLVVSTAGIESPLDVVIRTTTTRQLVAALGSTGLSADRDPRPRWWTASDSDSGAAPVRRALTQADTDPLRLRFACRREESGLEFLISVPGWQPGIETDLLLYFGSQIFECIEHPGGELFCYDRARELRLADCALGFDRDGDGCYRIRLPGLVITTQTSSQGTVSMLLGARRWSDDGNRPTGSTLVPIEIQLGG